MGATCIVLALPVWRDLGNCGDFFIFLTAELRGKGMRQGWWSLRNETGAGLAREDSAFP